MLSSSSETLAIGIDVGASNTKIGLVDSRARLLDHHVLPSHLEGSDPTPFLEMISAVIRQYTPGRAVQGIGVSLCCLVNAEHTGALLSVNAPALNGLNIQQALHDRFGCAVQVLNDVQAYALAEYHHGAGRGAERLLCLALGTGLAIAVILHGRCYETWGGVPADAGRIILQPEAEARCNAGVRGSAEALCGVAQIERLARAAGGDETLSARQVIAAAREQSDERAVQVMGEIGGHVGHLLALLSPVYFPQRILVTGGTAEAGEPLFRAIRARYATLIGDYMTELARLERGEARPVEILKGGLGPEASILGAAWGFLQNG